MGHSESKHLDVAGIITTALEREFGLTGCDIYLPIYVGGMNIYRVYKHGDIQIVRSAISEHMGIRINGHNIYERQENSYNVMCRGLPKSFISLKKFAEGEPIRTSTIDEPTTITGDCYILVKLPGEIWFCFGDYTFHHEFALEPNFEIIRV